MFKTINGGQLPTRGSKHSACVDLHAREDIEIGAGETKLIPLGVCIDLDLIWKVEFGIDSDMSEKHKNRHKNLFKDSHYLQLMLRSSLSKHLIIANGVGIIDMDYEGEIMIRIHNPVCEHDFNIQVEFGENCYDGSSYEIKKGDRVAQITLLEHKSYLFSIDTEDERTGGFGSTNKKETNHE